MAELAGAEVTEGEDGKAVIRKYVKAGDGEVQEQDTPYTYGLREREHKVRSYVQKALFDIALNLGPFLQQEIPEDREIVRELKLQAEESAFADQFDGIYQAFQLLHPPVDPISLVHISQSLPIIEPIVDSMKTNIEGFGQIFVPILDFEDTEVRQDLRDHFDGRLLQELETDGVIRLRKIRDGLVPIKKAKTDDPWTDLVTDALGECIPLLKHRTKLSSEDKGLAVRAWKNELPLFFEKNGERIQKIRERTFQQRMAKLTIEKRDEKKFLENFFFNVNAQLSWMMIRKRLRDDFERIGGWAMEIFRNRESRMPEQLGHVPMIDVRMTHKGHPIKAPVKMRVNKVEIVEKPMVVKFRKYVQSLGRTGRFIWFKEFGDSRIMNRTNGLYVGEYRWNQETQIYDQVFFRHPDMREGEIGEAEFLETNPNFVEANEILFHGRYNAVGSPYPVPRWFGCLTLAQGLIAMEEVNSLWFDNNLIPPMIVKVSDGNLSQKSEQRIKAMFEERRGREKMTGVLVLEAESESRARNFANTGKPVIEIEKLRDVIQQDATHTEYDEKGRLKLRGCWRLPPAHVGQESQYTRQSINASKVAAEEQVFQPERRDFDDVMNKHVLPALRINHWFHQTNSPPVADNLQMAQVLSILGKSGFLPVGEGRPEVEMILNRPLRRLPDTELSDTPFPLVLIEAKAGLGGDQSDGSDENAQNKMGARPDKDGFMTDSTVMKSRFSAELGIQIGDVSQVSFEKADEELQRILGKTAGVFLRDEDKALFFITRASDGSILSFRQEAKAA